MFQMLILGVLISSCATAPKSEDQHYIEIKSLIAKDFYSRAVVEIYEFEEKFPNSRYMCDLYNFTIAYQREYGMESNAQKYKKKYDEVCDSRKK